MRLRSLAFKLTLAFLFVSLVGAGLAALFVDRRTEAAFGRFVLSREQAALVDDLARYYRFNDGWQGVEAAFWNNDPNNRFWHNRNAGRPGERGQVEPPGGVLVDAGGTILLSAPPGRTGDRVSQAELARGVPVRSRAGQVAGWYIFDGLPAIDASAYALAGSLERAFLDAMRHAILTGAAGAILIALVLGLLLARTLTRPIRELTAATQVVAEGRLGHQVAVRSRDELGDLAASFNRMSLDLAEANRQRRQMTADIAHDLRTPLSILLGYTEALSDGKLPATPEVHAVMHREAQHLSHLIDDLRTLSLADAGELSLNLQPCLPHELLAHTAAAHQGQAEAKEISLVVEAGRDLPAVMADPDRLAQVLGNLVVNALRYTPAGGRISLAAFADEAGVSLQVRDSGSGIPPEELPHIFNRFYRADSARQQEQGESGLGLAIARSLVEAHGGALSAESLPGQGAAFTILLPPAKPYHTEGSEESPEPPR